MFLAYEASVETVSLFRDEITIPRGWDECQASLTVRCCTRSSEGQEEGNKATQG